MEPLQVCVNQLQSFLAELSFINVIHLLVKYLLIIHIWPGPELDAMNIMMTQNRQRRGLHSSCGGWGRGMQLFIKTMKTKYNHNDK